ncbi:penicillin-binding protein 2 [Kineosporia sp. J2-2]|uniref:Penicillin-binding protein 2 n=1 Tax=Kineosporia corallincola TaxID=2835133 RepID=A0ABS5TJC3_9ACTN|nr:penicillin-binding protein 2 [Kineosporia corallincola]MBT0771197.1 penicillin-binding protein 2 [Kineosporia corallincola]
MNSPIRRLAAVITVLFASLFISVTYIQVVSAASLEDNARNTRSLTKERSRQRGQILAGSKVIASSEPSDDVYKYLRSYSSGAMYAPVTGYYSVRGNSTGLEGAENEYLSGSSDELFIRNLTNLLTGEQPSGATVQTTINPKAQKAAWDALGDQRGAVIALNPKTGEILAMVSRPSYNPNSLAEHDTDKALDSYAKLNADDLEPLLNRTINQLYPPGSTFKLVTSAAALSSGEYSADSSDGLIGDAIITLPGTSTTLKNDTNAPCADGSPTLTEALVESCNTTYAQLGIDLGEEAMSEQASKFGFGQDLTIPQRVTESIFSDGALADSYLGQSSIGQYNVRTTPLQVAMIAAGIANDGVVMRPNLVKKVTSADGKTVSEPGAEELSEAVTPEVAEELTEMMKAVVQNGTGTNAQISGVEVAGKTGTAQNAEGAAPHAWFTSFAPADDPQVAVAVVVESGGKAGNEAWGGTVAAPIAKAVMEAVIK